MISKYLAPFTLAWITTCFPLQAATIVNFQGSLIDIGLVEEVSPFLNLPETVSGTLVFDETAPIDSANGLPGFDATLANYQNALISFDLRFADLFGSQVGEATATSGTLRIADDDFFTGGDAVELDGVLSGLGNFDHFNLEFREFGAVDSIISSIFLTEVTEASLNALRTAPNGSAFLRLDGNAPGGLDFFTFEISDVSVSLEPSNPASVVPLPGGMILLSTGLALAGMLRRRRQKPV